MHGSEAVALLVLALGAFLVPLLAERIALPAPVAEILFGILVSRHVLGWVEPTPYTGFLAEFGFALLMFLAGMEIDFARLQRIGRRGVLPAAAAALLVNLLALAAVLATGYPLFLVVVLGTMSLGLVMATLRALGLLRTPLGQTILLVGTVGEFITLILLTVADMSLRHGVGLTLLLAVGRLALVFLLAWAVLVALRTLVWWFPDAFQRLERSHDTAEIGVRASLALMLGFVALGTLLGVEAILGAFLAGALFAFAFRGKAAIEAKLSSIGFGFFIPVFFIQVGMNFDVSGLLRGDFWGDLAFLAAASLAAKALGSLALLRTGLRPRDALAAGFLLSAPLTLLVAEARIGAENGALAPPTAFALVLFAVLGGVVLPVAFRFLALGARPAPAAPAPPRPSDLDDFA